MAPEKETTLNQDLLAVIKATAAGLASAYGKMTHPLLVEKERDEFYFGMMGKIGDFRKEIEKRVQDDAQTRPDSFQQFIRGTEGFITDIFTLRAISASAIEATQRIAGKNTALVKEEAELSALDRTLRERFSAKSKGDPVPPLAAIDEEKLEQLDAQYGGRVGESKFFRQIERETETARKAGDKGITEERTIRGAEIRELALVDLANDGCNDARKQMLAALHEIVKVQSSIGRIMERYDMEIAGRNESRTSPSQT
jgi:hypothetical protein